ncbi:MAG: caspase family protein [Bacteroidales bacterium]|nr:caspase family protein [Bacteroidales bacterium]
MDMKKLFALLVVFWGLSSCSFFQEQKIYLVSVGIADYPGIENDLRLPAEDANTIVSIYKANRKAYAVLLTDSEATRTDIITAMKNTYMKAKRNDIVVFFFSGHGYEHGGFVAYDKELTYDDVRKAFSESRSKHKMIFADACFSGKIRTDSQSSGKKSLGQDVMLFLSSRSDEVSFERPSMKNGFYTTCLERCLRGGADANKDRVITAKELYEGVSKGVIKLSQGKQHPVMWGNFDDDMPVMIW